METSNILANNVYLKTNKMYQKFSNVDGDAKDLFLKKQYQKAQKKDSAIKPFEEWVDTADGKDAALTYDKRQNTLSKITKATDFLKSNAENLKVVADTIKGGTGAKSKNINDKKDYDLGDGKDKGDGKILGMQPLTFGLVVLGVVGVSIGAYMYLSKK